MSRLQMLWHEFWAVLVIVGMAVTLYGVAIMLYWLARLIFSGAMSEWVVAVGLSVTILAVVVACAMASSTVGQKWRDR